MSLKYICDYYRQFNKCLIKIPENLDFSLPELCKKKKTQKKKHKIVRKVTIMLFSVNSLH